MSWEVCSGRGKASGWERQIDFLWALPACFYGWGFVSLHWFVQMVITHNRDNTHPIQLPTKLIEPLETPAIDSIPDLTLLKLQTSAWNSNFLLHPGSEMWFIIWGGREGCAEKREMAPWTIFLQLFLVENPE